MIELDNLDELEACGLGWRRVGDADWRFSSAAERLDAMIAPSPRSAKKPRPLTLEAALKAADRAGRQVKGATLEGERITLIFGQPDAAKADDEIETPEQLRRLI